MGNNLEYVGVKENKMAKKEGLKEEIAAIHDKAKQLEEELKDMGLDDVIHEQEMVSITAIISNNLWGSESEGELSYRKSGILNGINGFYGEVILYEGSGISIWVELSNATKKDVDGYTEGK